AWEILPKQIRALQESPLFPALVADLGLPPPEAFLGEGAWEEAERLAREADALLDREGRDLGLHYRLALLYSALLDADRRLAGQAPPKGEGIPIPPEAAEAHLARKSRPTPLSPQREALFRGVGEVLEGPLEKVFPARLTLTAPTGAGKTLAALRFALALRERVHRDRGFRPK
ncbi:MAG: CRISPR-associated endonuclease Cas3'', partial [Candidatus Bipolaricaulota bacterium]|nr:CRISPR-associated endonuclease Cas3'' [Candidatus Bipolaricaulota bacterium]